LSFGGITMDGLTGPGDMKHLSDEELQLIDLKRID
jgi:hypothetical protein